MLNKNQMTEEDIKLQYITPAVTSKWNIRKITMETQITDGRINLRGNVAFREKPKRADYVLYLNANNPIAESMDNMDKETIKKIFSGEYTTWDQVDSSLPKENINVYIRDLSGGAYEVFQKSIMGDVEISGNATQSASMTELATNIAGDQWGIGYAGFGAYNKANADGKKLVAMKVDGVEANEENILNGSYIIQRPVMFVTGKPITASEQAFIDYIFSQTGYETVESNGYIPAFTPKA